MAKKSRNESRRRSDQHEPPRFAEHEDPEPWSPWLLWAVRVCISIYVVWLIVLPPTWLDPTLRSLWRGPQLWVHGVIGHGLNTIGLDEASRFLRVGVYYVLLLLVVPGVACLLLRRGRPADTGWRKPNRLLLRIVGTGLLVSIPFLFWMVRSPAFVPYYRPYLDAGPATVLTYYLVVLFCEHFFFEGVILAAFRANGRWPNPAKLIQDAPSGWRRAAQWFGVAQPVGSARGLQRVTRWLGLPAGCCSAILLSGALFGLVHWGKGGREFLLAFPGGVFLAALAYRCNSWHAPYLLHAGTVSAAALIALLTHR